MSLFCVAPWFAREIDPIGRDTPCCLVPIGSDFDKIRETFLKNEWPKECTKCQILEQAGQTSDRQIRNSTLDFYWDQDIEVIREHAVSGNSEVRMLTLATSSTCNSQCVTCGPHYSSSWRRLEKHTWRGPTSKISLIDLAYKLDLSKLITLNFVGGEPLYERTNFAILEKLLEKNNKKVFVSMVTNGSVSLTEYQKDILRQFPNLNFCVSIDGTKRLFEYMRYPLKWDNLLDNIKFLRTLTTNISASYTISNVNIQMHNETISWFKDNDIPYNYNRVTKPEYFNPSSLPARAKQQLELSLTTQDYQALITTHNDQHDILFKEAVAELDRQDQLKGINRKDFLPAHSFFY
jgi:hypothetical protein